jgi:hypothetical protein
MAIVVLVGLGVTLGALVIQAVAGGLGAEAASELLMRRSAGASLWRNSLATLVLIVVLVGHMAQVAMWATAFISTESSRSRSIIRRSTTRRLDMAILSCRRAGASWGRWKPPVARLPLAGRLPSS